MDDLKRFEALVADALTSSDPVASLRAASADLPPELRAAVEAADEAGLRMTALIVARLRFERLIRGSTDAGAWFDRAPEEFAAAFKRYHVAVPPTAHDPRAEAELFDAYLSESR